jgi:hypothetical protein
VLLVEAVIDAPQRKHDDPGKQEECGCLHYVGDVEAEHSSGLPMCLLLLHR